MKQGVGFFYLVMDYHFVTSSQSSKRIIPALIVAKLCWRQKFWTITRTPIMRHISRLTAVFCLTLETFTMRRPRWDHTPSCFGTWTTVTCVRQSILWHLRQDSWLKSKLKRNGFYQNSQKGKTPGVSNTIRKILQGKGAFCWRWNVPCSV